MHATAAGDLRHEGLHVAFQRLERVADARASHRHERAAERADVDAVHLGHAIGTGAAAHAVGRGDDPAEAVGFDGHAGWLAVAIARVGDPQPRDRTVDGVAVDHRCREPLDLDERRQIGGVAAATRDLREAGHASIGVEHSRKLGARADAHTRIRQRADDVVEADHAAIAEVAVDPVDRPRTLRCAGPGIGREEHLARRRDGSRIGEQEHPATAIADAEHVLPGRSRHRGGDHGVDLDARGGRNHDDRCRGGVVAAASGEPRESGEAVAVAGERGREPRTGAGGDAVGTHRHRRREEVVAAGIGDREARYTARRDVRLGRGQVLRGVEVAFAGVRAIAGDTDLDVAAVGRVDRMLDLEPVVGRDRDRISDDTGILHHAARVDSERFEEVDPAAQFETALWHVHGDRIDLTLIEPHRSTAIAPAQEADRLVVDGVLVARAEGVGLRVGQRGGGAVG